jgi:hypothetical protein
MTLRKEVHQISSILLGRKELPVDLELLQQVNQLLKTIQPQTSKMMKMMQGGGGQNDANDEGMK